MIDIIKACTDLGTHVCGAELGPDRLMEEIQNDRISGVYQINKDNVTKALERENKKKNMEAINSFNQKLYETMMKVIEAHHFPITVGGDHSIAIGSALGSIAKHENMGVIWVDAHADYHTFETTITGNIHGLPLATITGRVPFGLTEFHHGNYFRPNNSVLVGARSIDLPQELNNLHEAGVTIYTDDDVKRRGIDAVMEEAFKIASNGTNGVHVSLDVDVINPIEAPGVSIPEVNGFSKEDFFTVVDMVVTFQEIVRSIDLVEFNPLNDEEGKTFEIVKKTLLKLVNGLNF